MKASPPKWWRLLSGSGKVEERRSRAKRDEVLQDWETERSSEHLRTEGTSRLQILSDVLKDILIEMTWQMFPLCEGFSPVEENGGRPYKSLQGHGRSMVYVLPIRWLYAAYEYHLLPATEKSTEIWILKNAKYEQFWGNSAKHPNSQARVLLTASWIDHGALVEITAWSFLSLGAKTTPTSDRKQKENTMSLVQFSGNLQQDETICDKMPQEITKHIKASSFRKASD